VNVNDSHIIQLMPLSHCHPSSLAMNPEWFTILVLAYPGLLKMSVVVPRIPKGWKLDDKLVCATVHAREYDHCHIHILSANEQ